MQDQRSQYTQEFKDHAVQLVKEVKSATQVAKQLGVSESNIRKWIKKRGQDVELKAMSLQASLEELQRLRRENAELKKVNHILKAAAAVFCQDQFK